MNSYENANWEPVTMMNYAQAQNPAAGPGPQAAVSGTIGFSSGNVQGQAAGILVLIAGLVLLYVATRGVQNGRG